MARTIRSSTTALLAVTMLATILGAAAWAGNPGDAGFLSLRMPIGARESGMGDAGVASSTGASAVFWNPANNVFEDFQTELMLQHYRYLGLFNQEAAAIAHRVGDGVLGFVFMGFYSDELMRYTTQPEGTYKPYDVAFGASYAHPIGERLALGVNAKVVYKRIDIYSDTGLAFDFFASHQALIEGLTFGASLTNVGKQLKLYQEPFDLPTAYRVGAAWQPVGSIFRSKVTFSADVFIPEDTNEKAHVGVEYRFLPEFSLRVGSKINYDLYGLTAGIGFRVDRLRVDYAFQDMTIDGFDEGHKFSLGLVW